MSSVQPGWYPDPADPSTQRYWDGEGWLGDALPADVTPPPGPPAAAKLKPQRVPAQIVVVAPEPPPAPPGWPPNLPFPLPPGPVTPRMHGFRLAAPGVRFMARFVDIFVVLFLNVLGNGYFAYQWWKAIEPTYRAMVDRGILFDYNAEGVPPVPDRAGVLQVVMLFVAVALWFAYEVPAIAGRGQTLGKRLFAIKVVRVESTEPIGFRRAWRRWNPLGLPTLLYFCCGIGLLLQFLDCLFVAIDRPLHQAIHDKSAGTVVIDVHRPAAVNGESR